MNLRDWMSNDESVMEKIPHNDKANQDLMKVLGLMWLVNNDILSFSKQMLIQQGPTLKW